MHVRPGRRNGRGAWHRGRAPLLGTGREARRSPDGERLTMDIVTLQQVKDQCGETTAARDAYLTQVAEGIETEIFAYLRASTKEAITATCPPELAAQADAILEHAVLRWINPRIKD